MDCGLSLFSLEWGQSGGEFYAWIVYLKSLLFELDAALTAALMEVIYMNMYGFTFKCHLQQQHTKAPKNGMRRAETEVNKCCVHNPASKGKLQKYISSCLPTRKKEREREREGNVT